MRAKMLYSTASDVPVDDVTQSQCADERHPAERSDGHVQHEQQRTTTHELRSAITRSIERTAQRATIVSAWLFTQMLSTLHASLLQ